MLHTHTRTDLMTLLPVHGCLLVGGTAEWGGAQRVGAGAGGRGGDRTVVPVVSTLHGPAAVTLQEEVRVGSG